MYLAIIDESRGRVTRVREQFKRRGSEAQARLGTARSSRSTRSAVPPGVGGPICLPPPRYPVSRRQINPTRPAPYSPQHALVRFFLSLLFKVIAAVPGTTTLDRFARLRTASAQSTPLPPSDWRTTSNAAEPTSIPGLRFISATTPPSRLPPRSPKFLCRPSCPQGVGARDTEVSPPTPVFFSALREPRRNCASPPL